MTKDKPKPAKFFSYYIKLHVFFRNRRQQKFNQILGNLYLTYKILGFDAHGVYRMDDTWIEENKLVEYLGNLLGDKLLNHDEKKTIQKVNLRKEPEEKLTKINKKIAKFYTHFAGSLKNIFGYVSYKNF